jgi:hypothetical protein
MNRRTTCQTEEGCIIIYIGNCKACNPEEGGDETGKTGEDRSSWGKPLASPTLRDTNRAATENILANFKPDIEVLLTLFDCLVNRKRMLNELGPFALLMHHFAENVNEFRKLTISKEEFEWFKDLVSSTITQAICG